MNKENKPLVSEPKFRTKQEIDYEYTRHAAELGHKMRLASQLEEEIPKHVQALKDLSNESLKLSQAVEPKLEKVSS